MCPVRLPVCFFPRLFGREAAKTHVASSIGVLTQLYHLPFPSHSGCRRVVVTLALDLPIEPLHQTLPFSPTGGYAAPPHRQFAQKLLCVHEMKFPWSSFRCNPLASHAAQPSKALWRAKHNNICTSHRQKPGHRWHSSAAAVSAADLRFGQPVHETHPHILQAGERKDHPHVLLFLF